ncbi:MAG TPA: GAF domain-containing protein, partial [Bryobacteraceae bacterium]|nr:GAF domain-containing protein [Bryobacteraceae bacterium]
MSAPRQRVRFKERTELLDFLLEVSSATAETLDLDELMESVTDIVRRVVSFDMFAILLLSEKRKELRIRHAVGHREEVVRHLAIPMGEGIVGAAAQQRIPILLQDVSKDERYLPVSDMIRSELCVPMIARNRVVGVIDVQSAKLGAYKEDDRALLRLIGGRVAFAIDNAQLYRKAERQYRTIRTLSKISNEFSSILELEELLAKIASSVRGLINYDAFNIFLVDSETRTLKHYFSIRYDERVNLDNIPLGKGITGAAASSREIVRVHDTSADPRYISSHPGINSEIAVPLVLQHRVIGVMNLECERLSFFTDEHSRTLGLLAPSVAIAVENARLYEEIGERERAMQEDLKAAFELQTVILPQEAPDVAGLEIAIGLRPARQISGDLYDFFGHGDDHFVVAFGDSSGKGAAAALYGAMLSGLMRTLAPRHRGPSELMKALNDELAKRQAAGKYATLQLLLW